ncbi:MAG: ferritin-like domain-containing protein [Ginsengibacter sp.]
MQTNGIKKPSGKTKAHPANGSSQNGSSQRKPGANGSSSATRTSGKNGSSSNESSMLEELFVDELKDIYWAEKHLLKALPKMQKAATSAELKNAFGDHLEVTKKHVSRLEQAFGLMDQKVQAKKCEAMAGLTKEADGIVEDTDKGTSTRDVGLIMAAQKVEHYEIATYGSLRQLAKTLGNNEVSDLMEATLSEEKEADETLTGIAENNINAEATAD